MKWGSPSRFINQPRSSRQRLRPHHEGAARKYPGKNIMTYQHSKISKYRDMSTQQNIKMEASHPSNASISGLQLLPRTFSVHLPRAECPKSQILSQSMHHDNWMSFSKTSLDLLYRMSSFQSPTHAKNSESDPWRTRTLYHK